jgi:predicted GH43/DUF377 family glycosyl hydrolase
MRTDSASQDRPADVRQKKADGKRPRTRASGSEPVRLTRLPVRLEPEPTRVITRLFIPGGEGRAAAILDRVLALSEEEATELLNQVLDEFSTRHKDLPVVFAAHYAEMAHYLNIQDGDRISQPRRLLIGAFFTMEYSLESIALFNPSIVLHPDQDGLEGGAARFIMSMRACGEGHISSIVFRSGTVSANGSIEIDSVSPFAATERPVEDKLYDKHPFFLKLIEMGSYNDFAEAILRDLLGHFTLDDLRRTVEAHRKHHGGNELFKQTAENILWVARSNYHLDFPPNSLVSERVIFPVTENESRGIEDARFVRFRHQDGRISYYATYTAYNGFQSLPQFIETEDFSHFKIITLNGRYAHNKGLAMFPRKINDLFMSIGRVDGQSLYLQPSDNRHFWNAAVKIQGPLHPWELVQIGNCGSPIETEKGWLLLTHGVGPMRKYCIGATLLDLEDPSRVVGHLREPLLLPIEQERDGYVPNVVYSCGSLVHNGRLIVPYAMSDTATGFATISMDELLSALTS